MRLPELAFGLMLLGLCVAHCPAQAECIDYGDYIHQVSKLTLPSPGQEISIQGDYAYIGGYDAGLYVVDISDLEALNILSTTAIPGLTGGVCVRGAQACVTGAIFDSAYVGLMHCVDVSDPQHPVVLGEIRFPASSGAGRVIMDGPYAYVATGRAGLWVVDISNPGDPRIVSSQQFSDFYVRDFAVAGPLAYVALNGDMGSGGFQIVDISDPMNIRMVGSLDVPIFAICVAVSGSYAYLGAAAAFHAIDVSNPEHPYIVGSLATVGADELVLTQTVAFVSDNYLGTLGAIDISDPANLHFVGGVPNAAGCVAIQGTRAFTTGGRNPYFWEGVLQVLDITNPHSPQPAKLSLPCTAIAVDVSGDYAYVADYDCGLKVVDISDPRNPEVVGTASECPWASGVAVKGGYAYVGCYSSLNVVNITDPTNPHVTGVVEVDARRLRVQGNYLYVASADQLRIFSIASPAYPSLLGSVQTATEIEAVAIEGDFAYLAEMQAGMQVVNVGDPLHPYVMGSIDASGYAYGIAANGSCVCVADDMYGLEIIDVADPWNPTLIASFLPENAGVAISGNFAYFGGMQVIDVSNPLSPDLVGCVPAWDWIMDAVVAGDNVILAGESGLAILPTHCAQANVMDGTGVVSMLPLESFPSPASGQTTLRLELPVGGPVRAVILDVTGRRVRGLPDGVLGAGVHDLHWDGRDDAGRETAAGVYIAKVSTAEGERTTRVVVLK